MTETAQDNAVLFEITPGERIAKLRTRLERELDKAERRREKADEKVQALEAELEEFDGAIAAVALEAAGNE